MNRKKIYVSLAAFSSVALAACGGGSSGSSTPSPGPALSDTVLFSNASAANSVTAVINKAGIIRAVGEGSAQALTLAAGQTAMAGNASLSTGNGWLMADNTFVPATVTLTANADNKSFTLAAQGGGNHASDATMQPSTVVIAPTLSALAGHYGITSSWAIDISGTSFSGTYGYNCTISGVLSPNSQTVDLTDITFQTAGPELNPNNNACPYAGKTYNGTGYLLGSSQAYANGAFDIMFDDSASGTPTSVNLFNFIKQ